MQCVILSCQIKQSRETEFNILDNVKTITTPRVCYVCGKHCINSCNVKITSVGTMNTINDKTNNRCEKTTQPLVCKNCFIVETH